MAAINKNFVVKNGLEISTDLIIADANTRKVGIGTTVPRYTLHVNGGIGVTNAYVSGITTVINELRVGTGGTIFSVIAGPAGVGQSVGVGTANPAFLLDIRSPVSTGQTALYVQGDVRITGDLSADDITFDDATLSNLTVTEALNVTSPGISTFGGYVDINSDVDISGTLNVSGITTLGSYVDINNSVDVSGALNVVGLSTLGGYVDINNSVDISNNLNVTGIATIATVDINAGEIDVTRIGTGNLSVTGIGTIVNGFITNLTGTAGTITTFDSTNGTITNLTGTAGTITTFNSTNGTITNLTGTAGTITTFNSTNSTITNLTGTNVFYSGIGTVGSLSIGSTQVISSARELQNIVTLDATTTATIEAAIANAPNTFTDLTVTGISTLGTVRISSGIITATSGIVTYFGDGNFLNLTSNPSRGIGIGTTGGLVGYGITFLDLKGAGVSTTFYNSSVGIATIFFEGGGGGSGSIGIGSTFTGGAANGDLFYHIDYGRIFVYYDEVVLGIGTDAFWVDAAPFNVGIITALSNVSFSPGSAVAPSMFFIGDNQTGFFSPGNGQFTVVSSGSSVLNVNASGINITGIATITNASGTVKIGIGTTALLVEGNARVTGILTVGSSSITLDGTTNTINVGTGLTLSSSGINITGVITATSFSGSGSGLTGVGLGTTGSINTSGIITATSFFGSGSGLTGVGLGTTGSINTSGIITASSFSGNGSGLTGVAATTLTIGAGTTALPSISPTGDTNTGIFFPSADTIAFGEGGAEAMRVDSSGRLLIGTSTSRVVGGGTGPLQVESTSNSRPITNVANENSIYGPGFALGKSRGASVGSNTIVQSNDHIGFIDFCGADGSDLEVAATISAFVDGTPGTNDMPGRLVFSTTADGASSPTERMRITSAGVLSLSGAPTGFTGQDPVKFGVSKRSSSGECLVHIEGHDGNSPGANTYALRISHNADAGNAASAALRIDHTNPAGGSGGPLIQAFGNFSNGTTQKLWEVYSYGQQVINRPANDGSLIDFQQAQTVEGSISVSGTTVSYNGAHLSRWSQLASGAVRIEILRGTVLSNLDEMCEWIDTPTEAVLWQEGDELPEGVSVGDIKEPANPGGPQDNEQLNRMKVSEVEGDKNVSGVFQCWDDDDDTYINDFYCAMTGDFIIRIADGVTVERGDLLMSAGDGTAKPQDDDIIRSKTVAKVTSTNVTCTYEDGSYCVPCVLMAC